MKLDKSLGSVLKNIRTERKMSLRDFSQIIGISHAYLYKLENIDDPRTKKPIMPTIDVLIIISSSLGISLEEFLKMCGYTSQKSLKVSEPEYINSVDVFDELQNLMTKISIARNIIFNENLIEAEDIQKIESNVRDLSENLMEQFGK